MELVSYKYSIPYVIVLAILVILSLVEFRNIHQEKSTKTVRLSALILLLIFIGCRGFINTDWYNYYTFFNIMPSFWDSDFSFVELFSSKDWGSQVESGFKLYTVVIKSIYNNYFFWNFVSVLIDLILLKVIFNRYSNYVVFPFLIFFAFYGLGLETNLLRNIKAILLFLLSLKYVEERKFLPFLLINTIGFLFHNSAIVFLPLYFILHKPFPKWLLISIFLIGNILYFFQIHYLEPLLVFVGNVFGGVIESYIERYPLTHSYPLSIGHLERLLFFILLLIYYPKKNHETRWVLMFYNCFVLFFIAFVCFAESQILVGRIGSLFSLSFCLIIPDLYDRIAKKRNKQLFLSFVFVLSFAKVALTNTIVWKYDNILWGIESYEKRTINLKKHFGKEDL